MSGRWGNGENSGGKLNVSKPSGPWPSDLSCRELPALPIGSCCVPGK
jgi:hypothetical protein